ncbi:hypothetical protein RRG08_046796 [Elysia crispata]|uniref:Uncharacterized protein n=1 Tax=Elysia crispata TaxID=231223 RepID=A0AAE1DMK3_9GAST|nr:hypothetical protein RRG08_046796 [Elysia crispata]
MMCSRSMESSGDGFAAGLSGQTESHQFLGSSGLLISPSCSLHSNHALSFRLYSIFTKILDKLPTGIAYFQASLPGCSD